MRVIGTAVVLIILLDIGLIESRKYFKDVVQSHDAEYTGYPPPCLHAECPLYNVTEKGSDYELRSYDSTQWVMTHGVGTGNLDSDVLKILFQRLDAYRNGKNEAGMIINVTYPALVRIDLYNEHAVEKRFHLHYLLPKAIRDNPPKPTGAHVYFIGQKRRKRYVRSFDKRCSTYKSYEEEKIKLQDSLRRDKKAFSHDHFFYAEYYLRNQLDSYYTEIWIDWMKTNGR